MDTLESIRESDREYHERCDNLKIAYECTEQGETCWWPECGSHEQALGLCPKHLARLKRGKLLVCSFDDYGDDDRHDIADTVLEFVRVAEAKGVTPEKLLQLAVITTIEIGTNWLEKNREEPNG